MEKHRTDIKEVKEKHVEDLQEKVKQIAALKKKISAGKKAQENEITEVKKMQGDLEFGERKSMLSVEAHAEKQPINGVVRQRQLMEAQQKREFIVIAHTPFAAGAGFLGMMQCPNNVLTNSLHLPMQMLFPGMMNQGQQAMGMMNQGQPMMMSMPMTSGGGFGNGGGG